jgi:hypothetical protein
MSECGQGASFKPFLRPLLRGGVWKRHKWVCRNERECHQVLANFIWLFAIGVSRRIVHISAESVAHNPMRAVDQMLRNIRPTRTQC